MAVPILAPERRWQCPSCDRQLVTHDNETKPRLHPCRGLRGILAPFVEVDGLELRKHSTRHVVNEREDYVGAELVRTDAEGRPVMSVVTERADGSNDCHVFVPTATAHATH